MEEKGCVCELPATSARITECKGRPCSLSKTNKETNNVCFVGFPPSPESKVYGKWSHMRMPRGPCKWGRLTLNYIVSASFTGDMLV